jgi:two-component system, NarL family, response regulator DesR
LARDDEIAKRQERDLMNEQSSAIKPAPSRVRLVIADDAVSVRQELRGLLELFPEVQVVGEAADGAEALEQALRLQPEVVILDLEMPTMDGYEAARQLKSELPGCRLVSLSVHGSELDRSRALASGIDVCLIKGDPFEQLIQALTVQAPAS